MPRRRSTVFSCLPNRPWLLKRYYVLLIRCCREKAVQTNCFVGVSNCPCLRAGGETNACCSCCNGFTPKPKEIFRKRTRHSGRTQGGGGSRRKRDRRKRFLPYQAGHGCKKVMRKFFQWPEEAQNTLGTKHTSPESAGESDHGDALKFLSRVSTPRFQRSDPLASCESLPRGLFRL